MNRVIGNVARRLLKVLNNSIVKSIVLIVLCLRLILVQLFFPICVLRASCLHNDYPLKPVFNGF
jgi:hypothetical protein